VQLRVDRLDELGIGIGLVGRSPLPPTDPADGTAFSAILSPIIAGVLGSAMLYLVTCGRALAVHLSAVIALGIGAELVMALATNVVVGAFASGREASAVPDTPIRT
jgi:hypothetical protein